jgi:hypothetical protein
MRPISHTAYITYPHQATAFVNVLIIHHILTIHHLDDSPQVAQLQQGCIATRSLNSYKDAIYQELCRSEKQESAREVNRRGATGAA